MTLTLAIVGRPNVGKSTLFNRLARKQLALVDDTPGLTRDWREAEGVLFDKPIRILDTAGLEEAQDDTMEARMRAQTEYAIEKADVILFLIDGRAGLTPLDEHFAKWIRKQKKPVILAVNKCEHEAAAMAGLAEAYKLGLGDPIPLSAAHGEGLSDLYDMLSPHFSKTQEEEEAVTETEEAGFSEDTFDDIEGDENYEFKDDYDETKAIKIAIVGRPNAGKSTLMNALLKEQRVVTSPEAGTTRDAIAVDWMYKNQKLRLVDTAGLRKKAKVTDRIEKMATDDTMRAIRLAQVVILVIDAQAPLEKQDLQIADHVISEGRVLILAVNKWDSVKNRKETLETIQDRLEASLAQVRNIPYITMSALRENNLEKLMDTAMQTYVLWNKRISTSNLNRWLAARESQNPAPLVNGRSNRLKYITQIKARPPTFVLWVSQPGSLPDTYKRYLLNSLREDYGLPGIAVRLLVRTSKNPYI